MSPREYVLARPWGEHISPVRAEEPQLPQAAGVLCHSPGRESFPLLTLLQASPLLKASSALSCSRCWQCGESLLGRIPFHYLDFSFCSTACLQTHRRAQAGHT